ncbi:large ribosomal subunit protein mL46-like [Daphnia carinata]|uniref:large ribosomal subunit protein mL46-like n=1 Tax=Daphnia carinata TaxID=120202 RepID=UPI00257C4536|nr:large ribosomal subunit protein mL46-like [Daphnia carinata]
MLSFRFRAIANLSTVKNGVSLSNVCQNTQSSSRMLYDTLSTTNPSPKWQLLSAVCLERTPIIMPPMAKIEEEMAEIFEKLDTTKSLKSDHELKQDEDKKVSASLVDGNQDENNPDAATRQTAQDFEDACNEELNKFIPSPRITAEDLSGDRKSTNRKLDKHLLFVVQEKNEGKKIWKLPQAQWINGETLRETAERALKEHVKTPDTSVRVLGNAPWGVHTIKYPSATREKVGFTGAKIFFFKAQLLSGCTTCSNTEYHWLGRNELTEYFDPQYLRSVQKFLIDED